MIDHLNRTSDGGATWNTPKLLGSNLSSLSIFDLEFLEDGTDLAVAYKGVWQSSDNGVSWRMAKWADVLERPLSINSCGSEAFIVNQAGDLAILDTNTHATRLLYASTLGCPVTEVVCNADVKLFSCGNSIVRLLPTAPYWETLSTLNIDGLRLTELAFADKGRAFIAGEAGGPWFQWRGMVFRSASPPYDKWVLGKQRLTPQGFELFF